MDTITGMLICNDRRWPEAFRVLALQGAEIVALGFNTPTENLHYGEPPALRVHHHLIMAQSMAFQNATWLVETAKAGRRGRFPHVRPLRDRRADRRDRGEEPVRGGRGDLSSTADIDLAAEPEENDVQLRGAPAAGALQA